MAAILVVVNVGYGLALPRIVRALDLRSAGFAVIGWTMFAVRLATGVLLALGARLLVRAVPSRAARAAARLAAATVIVELALLALPLVMNRLEYQPWVPRVVTAVQLLPAALQLGALIALGLAMRVVAGRDREPVAAAALAVAALHAVRVPALAWRFGDGSLGAAWGLEINVIAGAVLFLVVVAVLRRPPREVPA